MCVDTGIECRFHVYFYFTKSFALAFTENSKELRNHTNADVLKQIMTCALSHSLHRRHDDYIGIVKNLLIHFVPKERF